jgi:hypothetical protein
MRRISARERRLLAIAAAVVGLFAIYRVLYFPMITRWQGLHVEAARLQAELAGHRASIRQKEKVEGRYRDLEEQIRQRGTDQEEIARFLGQVREKYAASALSDRGIYVLPVEDGGFYRKFRLRLELEGGVIPLADFLHAIGSSGEPLKVEELTVSATGTYEMVRATMLLTALLVPPQEGPRIVAAGGGA